MRQLLCSVLGAAALASASIAHAAGAEARLTLARSWCAPGVACGELAGQVVPLAVRFRANPRVRLGAAASWTPAVRAMAKRARDEGYVQLPPQIFREDEPYQALGGGDDAFFPVVAGGKTYLARLGKATLGYGSATMGLMVIPDYNVAIYTTSQGRLQVVAGFRIDVSKQRPRRRGPG
jgi:hypothetical protein